MPAPSLENMTPEQIQALARVGQALLGNKSVSLRAKKLLKEIDPNFRNAELEVEEAVEARTQGVVERQDKLEQDMIQANAQRALERKHQAAREAGIDPEEVEKAITERGIANWETAMEFVQMKNQAAVPTTDAGHQRFALPEGKGNGWWSDPTKKARDEAHAAIDELRGRRRTA